MKHQGLHINRLTESADNPREVAFAQEWEKENASIFETEASKIPSHWKPGRYQRQFPSDRDFTVAAAVIQWLGSNVGMSFLRNALGRVGLEIVEKK